MPCESLLVPILTFHNSHTMLSLLSEQAYSATGARSHLHESSQDPSEGAGCRTPQPWPARDRQICG